MLPYRHAGSLLTDTLPAPTDVSGKERSNAVYRQEKGPVSKEAAAEHREVQPMGPPRRPEVHRDQLDPELIALFVSVSH